MPDGSLAAKAAACDAPAHWRRLVDIAAWPLVEPPEIRRLLELGLAASGERIDRCFAAQLEALHRNLRQPILRWPRPGTGRFDRLLLCGQPRAGTASLTNLLAFVGLAHIYQANLIQGDIAKAMIAPIGDPFWFDLTPYTLGPSTLASTHPPPSPRLVQFLARHETVGVVLAVRDPADSLVSFARMAMHARWIHPAFGQGRPAALVQRWAVTGRLFSEAPPGQPDAPREMVYLPSYFNALQSALLLAELPNCVVVRYEDAFDQSNGGALHAYLTETGVTAVEWPAFEAAYHRCMLFRNAAGREPGQLEATQHLARGQVGSWRDEWAADLTLLDHPVVRAYCARFGYQMPDCRMPNSRTPDSRTPAGEPAGAA